MYKFVAILYQYLVQLKTPTPYLRTMLLLSFMIFIHLTQFGLLFNIPIRMLFIWDFVENKVVQRIMVGIYFLILTSLLYLVFKKNRLDREGISPDEMKKWRVIIPTYIILNILLMGILLLKAGIDKGTIKF